jgi:hypothetical protein
MDIDIYILSDYLDLLKLRGSRESDIGLCSQFIHIQPGHATSSYIVYMYNRVVHAIAQHYPDPLLHQLCPSFPVQALSPRQARPSPCRYSPSLLLAATSTSYGKHLP